MGRRRFDHLFVELSMALGHALSRYDLWLRLHEHGFDPERLTRSAVLAFCDGPLQGFLAERQLELAPRRYRRLRRELGRYDPSLPTPEERLAESEY